LAYLSTRNELLLPEWLLPFTLGREGFGWVRKAFKGLDRRLAEAFEGLAEAFEGLVESPQ
jgi:hypothetical protein